MSHQVDRLLVCGSRTWADTSRVSAEIAALAPRVIIHGACPTGADACADTAARATGLTVVQYHANWKEGKGAGPRRNLRMLRDGCPDHGLAFGALWKSGVYPDAESKAGTALWQRTGTGDMVINMIRAGIPVRWVATPDTPAVDLTAMPLPTP